MTERQEIIDTFATRLKEARRLSGMTQKEFAKAVEMTQGNITNMEAGRHLPSIPALVRISRVLDTSVAILLGEIPNPRKRGG